MNRIKTALAAGAFLLTASSAFAAGTGLEQFSWSCVGGFARSLGITPDCTGPAGNNYNPSNFVFLGPTIQTGAPQGYATVTYSPDPPSISCSHGVCTANSGQAITVVDDASYTNLILGNPNLVNDTTVWSWSNAIGTVCSTVVSGGGNSKTTQTCTISMSGVNPDFTANGQGSLMIVTPVHGAPAITVASGTQTSFNLP